MLQKKGTKIVIGIIGGVLLGLFTVIAIVYLFLLVFFYGGPPKVTKKVDAYEETMLKYTQCTDTGTVRTGFYVFPDSIPDSAFAQDTQPDFYFSYQDTWDDPTCEVYLKCTYSPEDYEAELKRIQSIEKPYETLNKGILYDDTGRFNYPAYLAIDHHDYAYEYALDIGDNSIVYVYTAYKTKLKKLKQIPEEYLPSDFEESLDLEHGSYWATGNYDIYEYPTLSPDTRNGMRDFD